MKLSIIVPVFNEEKTIGTVLKKLCALKLPILVEIIVIDDGSADSTASEIKNFKFNLSKQLRTRIKNFKLIRHKNNQGKGTAVRTGIKAATGDYVLIQDADLEYNPAEIPKLIAPILKSKNKNIAAYGSRFSTANYSIPQLYLWGNKFLTLLTNLLYGTKLTDMETGYKLLPASFLKATPLVSKRFDVEPEITAKLVRNKIEIVEVPISYRSRSHLAGKKLTLKDAFGAVKTLIINRV